MPATNDTNDTLVLATSMGLARNDAVLPFPHAAGDDDLEGLFARVEEMLGHLGAPGEWQVSRLDDLRDTTRWYLVERGLMTPSFSRGGGPGRGFAVYQGSTASLEINGDSHLRLLGTRVGDELAELWTTVDALDEAFEQELQYAFDERWGYLTPRPNDAGTGMRAYVTLHLPGLMITGRLGGIAVQLISEGLVLHPLWEGAGGLFQVSNRGGLGTSEERTAEMVRSASHQIAEKERAVRAMFQREDPVRAYDYIGRALGVAQHARSVGIEEALGLVSALLVGSEMGLFEEPLTAPEAFLLMRGLHPGHLAIEHAGLNDDDPGEDDLDHVRADVLRERFAAFRARDRRG
jgi:protein arginine kinase